MIKALFLQKKNFIEGEESFKQIQIAMEWEQIENELHKDDFWYYIKRKESKQEEFPNRIDYLLTIEYKANRNNWASLSLVEEENVSQNINRLNDKLTDKDALFRFYNDKFEGKTGTDLASVVKEEWGHILKCFRTLQDWYNDSEIYNYIGYLSQCGYDMAQIYHHYNDMSDKKTREDFIDYLKELVKESLSDIKLLPSEDVEFPYGTISSTYKKRIQVYNALLFLNVNLLNQRIVNMRKREYEASTVDIEGSLNSSIYKFRLYVESCG